MNNDESKIRKEHAKEARLESIATARYGNQPVRYFLMIRSKRKDYLTSEPLQEYDLHPWHDSVTDYWTAFIFETFDGAFTRRAFCEIMQKIQIQIPDEFVCCDLLTQPCDWISKESD